MTLKYKFILFIVFILVNGSLMGFKENCMQEELVLRGSFLFPPRV